MHVKRAFSDNEKLLEPLLERCQKFETILSRILENKLGFRAGDVDWTSEMKNWGNNECRVVGRSFAYFVRKRKTGDAALE